MAIERSWSNIVTVSCLIVVAVIEAYQQALSGAPSASAVLPRLDGAWNFAPLILLTLAGVFWLLGHLPKRHNVALQHNSVTTIPSAFPSPPPTPRLHGRVLANASPAELCRLYKDNTAIDANKLAESYIDTWLPISGTVYNARTYGDAESVLHVDGVEGVTMIHCRFGKESQKQVAVRKKGSPVNISGKIREIDSTTITLVECEFS